MTRFVVIILLETFIQFRNKNADKKRTRATFANNSLGTRLRGRIENAAPGPPGLLPQRTAFFLNAHHPGLLPQRAASPPGLLPQRAC